MALSNPKAAAFSLRTWLAAGAGYDFIAKAATSLRIAFQG